MPSNRCLCCPNLVLDQDIRLDTLAQSIGRQRDISLRINDEIGTHQGLLEELDHDLDTTSHRLGRARRQLGNFAQKAKENGTFDYWNQRNMLIRDIAQAPRSLSRLSYSFCSSSSSSLRHDELPPPCFMFLSLPRNLLSSSVSGG